MEISSSLIRARLRAKKDVSGLVDVKVLKYIKDRGLYGK
jgi:nicotinic acid mononucleotide adenylyltransferase